MTTSDNISAIEAIEKAMEGVTPGPWLTHGGKLGHKGDVFAPTAKQVTDCHHIARCFAPKPAKPVICELQAIQVHHEAITVSEANASYIAACNPVAMSAILAEARKAEAMKREIAELRKVLAGDHEVMPLSEERLDEILEFEEQFKMLGGAGDTASLDWATQRALIDEAVLACRARALLSKESADAK